MKILLPCLALLLYAATATAQSPPPAKRPNIVVILADDMGFSDVGCYGGEVQTPNIDRLAKDGVRFTQFYNASKCEPSRASLLSGLYWQQARKGIKRGITLGQALHSAGYTTLAAGKWHLLGNPADRGFDHYFGFLRGFTNYFKGDENFRLDHDPFKIPTTGFYTTDAFTDYAIRFVDQARTQSPDKPFFLYLSYNAPHDPLQAPPEDIARYKGKYARGWDALRTERYQRQIALGVIDKQWQLSARPDMIPAWDALSEAARQREEARMEVYAAMIDRMDQNVGRLLAKLKEWKLEDNTLVIFLSDNGANAYDRSKNKDVPPGSGDSSWSSGIGWATVSNTPFRLYKRDQHEGGVATPFIARWPAIIKNHGAITDQPAHIIDIMATCVDLSGCNYNAAFGEASLPATAAQKVSPPGVPTIPPLAGVSLSPLFAGKPWPGHDALFFQLRDQRAVRTANWKLASHDGGPWELYRMDADRTETQDLAGKQPEKVKELQTLYERWWNQDDVAKVTVHAKGPEYVDPTKELDKPGDEQRPEREPDDD